ncbi:MAG: extracellular solute-binding protein [Hungatella sp.]|nr:extracellular solute-binding protein [Hungatella sp.]
MKKRSVAALVLAGTVMGLTACSGGASDTPAAAAGSPREASEGPAQDPAKETWGSGDEVTKVSMMVATKATQGDWADYWIIKHIAQECGVWFEVDQVTQDAWSEKKNLAFASGDLPMVFLNDLTDTELATYGSQGLILPLEDYITKETMPNFFQVLEQEEYKDLLPSLYFPDGHIYAIRGINGAQREYAKSRFFINEAWSKALGFEKLPETLDEFYEYLCAVRDNDANGNGDASDEIPFGGSYNEDGTDYYDGFIPILTAFGYVSRTYQTDDAGKVIYVPEQDNYKEFLKYMNKLYTEGLLDSEYFTQTADQRKAKEASNLCGAFTDYASYLNITDPKVFLQFRGLKPMTSQFNSVQMWPSKDIVYDGAMVLTSKVTDEATIKKLLSVIDWCYSEEGTYATMVGPKIGQDPEFPEYGWELVGTDFGTEQRKWTYDEKAYETSSAYIDFHCTPGDNYFPFAQTADRCLKNSITMDVYENENTAKTLRLTYDIMNHVFDYLRVDWPDSMKLTAEEADELSLIETDLNSYKQTMESKMIIGDLDVDGTWDEFVSGLHSRGLDRYLEILQQAYDRWASNK